MDGFGQRFFLSPAQPERKMKRIAMSNTSGTSNPAQMLDRRNVLKSVAATLAAGVVGAPRAVFSEGAGPETTKAILGYIALTDAAPLIIAKERGLFAKYGMPDVDVVKQASWGALRDNTVLGGANNGIDGAHILTPMPYLISTGKVTQNNSPTPMYILSRLNLDCQGVSVSNEYKDLKAGVKADALKAAFARKKADGKDVKVAVTFPGGTHDLWMRYWLAAAGIDPDKDVSTIVAHHWRRPTISVSSALFSGLSHHCCASMIAATSALAAFGFLSTHSARMPSDFSGCLNQSSQVVQAV
jgi:ABC-type nitrate/sulfonate/bicarbonate transport system substrate-binding protein